MKYIECEMHIILAHNDVMNISYDFTCNVTYVQRDELAGYKS